MALLVRVSFSVVAKLRSPIAALDGQLRLDYGALGNRWAPRRGFRYLQISLELLGSVGRLSATSACLRDGYGYRSDGVGAAIENNQADAIHAFPDGHILTESDAMLYRSVTVLSTQMKVEGNQGSVVGPLAGNQTGNREPQLAIVECSRMNQCQISGIDMRIEAHGKAAFRIWRQAGAQPDFSGIEGGRHGRIHGVLGSGAGILPPGVIAGLGLDTHALARARDPDLVELVVPILLRRVVSDLVTGARVVNCLADRGAYVLAGIAPAARHPGELIEGVDAPHAAGRAGAGAGAAAGREAAGSSQSVIEVNVVRAAEHDLAHRIDGHAAAIKLFAHAP